MNVIVSPPKAPLIIDIGGQSNSNRSGIYVGQWPNDPRIVEYYSGVLSYYGPFVTGGHSFELGMGGALADATGRTVIISKGSVDSTTIASWLPASGVNWPVQLAAINASLRPTDLQVHWCWQHGEQDSSDGTSYADYLSRLQAVIVGVRAAYAPHPVRVHIGQVNSLWGGSGNANVRQAQADCATSDGNGDFIDLNDILNGGHYTSAQLINQIGPRYVTKILASL